MRCVVLGAAGFIGSALARRLVLDGHDVRVSDLVAPSMPLRQKAWRAANERLLGDLRRPDVAAAAVEGCDWVFHLAADVGGVGYLAAWWKNRDRAGTASVGSVRAPGSALAPPDHEQGRGS